MILKIEKKKYNVLLIGLGQIGFYYDWDGEKTKPSIQSHAKAFFLHDGFNLVAAVDPCLKARQDFSLAYNIPAYESLSDLPTYINYEIVVIATPTNFHLRTVDFLAKNFKPQCILCEKPVGYHLSEINEIESICEINNISFFVNYIRRVDPAVLEIKRLISSGIEGGILSGVVWYSKGFIHNASHFIDLLTYILGDIVSEDMVRLYGNFGDDFLADVNIEFFSGLISFKALQHGQVDYNSMELFTSNGLLEYRSGGRDVSWQPYRIDSVSEGYCTLGSEKKIIDAELERYQLNVVSALYEELVGNKTSLCRLKEAKSIHNVVNNLVV